MNILSFVNFNWYGFLIAMGVVAGVAGAYFSAVKRGYSGEVVFDIVIWAVPLAIVGARLYYVIFDVIDGNKWTFLQILGWNGKGFSLEGLAIYGGVLGGLLGVFFNSLMYRRKERKTGVKKETFLQMCDIGAPFLILGQAIGRWGNFANQEVYGGLVTNELFQRLPFAVKVGGQYYQALFLYESVLNLVGFGLLLWFLLGRRRSFSGFVIASYGVYYGLVRLILESFRTSTYVLYLIPGVLPVSQVVSVLIMLAGIGGMVYVAVKAKRANKRVPIMVSYDDWAQTGLDESEYGTPLNRDRYEYIEVDDEESVGKYLEALKSGKMSVDELKATLKKESEQKAAANIQSAGEKEQLSAEADSCTDETIAPGDNL